MNDLGQRLHHIQCCNECITFVSHFLFGDGLSLWVVCTCVCVSQCGWLVPRCQFLSTQEMEMNHGRQIKRMLRAHHILLKNGDDLKQGLPHSLTLSFFFLSLSLCSQTVLRHRASDQWLGLKHPIKISVTQWMCVSICVSECEKERQGEIQWWMIDDGCDLNRWLWAGQMTSSGGGLMRRRHRITAPSLCVYWSLTAATKQIAQ